MTSMIAGRSDLLAINDLLQGGQDAEGEQYEATKAQEKAFTPGDFGPPRSAQRSFETCEQSVDPKAIWGQDEALDEDNAFYDADDPRPKPEYDVVYKQSVMAEDTFLGMAGKTPGSQDCTHIVVKVVFPGCRLADLEVDVTKNSILAASPALRLATYLPHLVDETKGIAKWDLKQETLAVTLPIIDEKW